MSLPVDPALRGLDDCGCCAGIESRTPERIENRPGLPSIAYRSGTHSTFLASLLAGLSTRDRPQLRRLSTREPEDFTIAFLDAVATAADVLTFYQERIANESYLRTATERRSVLELARAIGYELAPGVAAEAPLAFTLETADGSPDRVDLPEGTKVQSIPGPGERPQTFETVEAIEARGAWNALVPRQTEPVAPFSGETEAYLAGVGTNLQPGDTILIVGDERIEDPGDKRWDFRVLDTVELDHARVVTRITWQVGLGTPPPRVIGPAHENPRIYALRTKLTLFGSAAPDWRLLTKEVRDRYDSDASVALEWPGLTISAIAGTDQVIHVDGLHREILPESWLVLVQPAAEALYRAREVDESARKGFGLASKTTAIELDDESLDIFEDNVRDAVVYGQSDPLEFAEHPIPADVQVREIVLDRAVEPLPAGRRLLVTGVPADGPPDAPLVTEPTTVATMQTPDGQTTTLVLEADLARPYRRETVQIAANVAQATHGERTQEPLGSGDAARPLQRFGLRQSPVTHVYGDTPTGRRATLDVRVDGVLWDEVPSLYGHGPTERVYTLRIDDEAKAAVQFGDGRAGARLPTGPENVSASYRVGLGEAGNLDPGTLSLLVARPLGLRGATNPLPAGGGADPEVLADARANAPLTVLTLDRIVSLSDHADFARAFAGIAKAHATWVWSPDGRGVLMTVAGTNGADVPADGPTHRSLLEAMDKARDTRVPVTVHSFEPVRFRIAATVGRDAALTAEQVLADGEAALAEHFSFTARSFGQAVPLSEVLAVLHGVPGVVSVDVNSLYSGTVPALNQRLEALVAAPGDDLAAARPAQLLTIDLQPGDLAVTG